MSCTVPNWDSDDVSALPRFDLRSHLSDSGNVPLVGYEMEELAWEKGGLIVNGLGLMRVSSQSNLEPNPYTAPKEDAWEKPRAAVGTLESIVDLAWGNRPPASKGVDDNHVPVKPPITRHRDLPESTAVASDMDLVVPCGIIPNKEPRSSTCVVGGSTRVELEEGSARKKAKTWPTPTRVPLTGECSVQQSQSSGGESWHVREADACEMGSGGLGLTTASFYTQGGTMSLSSNELPSSTNDSACLTQPQAKDEKKKTTKSSISTKRSRADTHNQSERKRRETINQKMRTLQKMVPNSNKTDKASMLDEVIDYLKQLQAQVHMMMMGRMGIPFVTMPYAMPQNPFQMPLVPSLGMGMDMNMNIINSAIMAAGLPPVMPTAPWDVASSRPPSSSNMGPSAHCQTQPMTMEAYNMMAALIQQQQQQQLASTTRKN